MRDLGRNLAGSFHLGVIANPFQQPICDAGRAAASFRDFVASFVRDRRIENLSRPADDVLHFRHRVEVQPMDHTETRTQRCGNQTGARGCADQGKAAQIEPMGPGTRALADDDVEFEILHRGIKDLFDAGLKTMNLVDKQDVAKFKIRQYRREIPFQLDQWTRSRPKLRAHFIGDHRSQCSLAEAWRTIEQNMVERFTALSSSLDGNIEIIFNALLSDILAKHARAKRQFERHFFFHHRTRYHSLGHIFLSVGPTVSAALRDVSRDPADAWRGLALRLLLRLRAIALALRTAASLLLAVPPTPFLASGPPSSSLRYTAFGGLFPTGRSPHALAFC